MKILKGWIINGYKLDNKVMINKIKELIKQAK